MATVDRRRQNRLWLSCVACRTRKAKCDRARPCRRCVQAGSADRCHYDVPAETSRLVAPGQHVFAVEAAKATEAAKAAKAAKAVDSLSLASDESAPRSPAHGFQPPSVPLPSTETGPLAPLQLLWHGSRAVDTYVEPLHERTISTPKEVVFGENDATVYWGRSHETNFVPRITDAAKLLLEPDSEDNVSTLYHVERSTRPGETIPVREHDPELMALLPTRADADRLVDVYIHTFETYYKIIHIPTFLRDYARLWDADPAVSVFGPPHFLAQLLSICAIGSGLITVGQQDPTTGTERDTGARMTSQWIEAVRLWLFKQNPRMQMTLGHLQAHLLMLVAGDTHWIKIDRSWISSGMLIRNAVSAGLHREPADFTRISPFYAELRRRLWYAIIEFDLQASFAKGRTPSIHDEDYDCRPPAAIVSDDMFNEGVTEADIDTVQLMHTPLPLYVCLTKSISLRTRVCRLVNGITLTSAYEQVLRLDAELKAFLVDAAAAIQTEPDTTKRILLSIITQRTTIALHAPFLSRTLHDPRYLYSRQVCVETATTVLTEALSLLDDCSEPKANQAFDMVNNICRCEIANSVFILCRELLTQVIERRRRQSSMTLMPSSQPKEQQQVMAHLVESTSHATAAICKPDIVSQRTCAWMQLSAELSRAAIGDDATTVISMKESIGRSIQAYRASIQQAEPDSTIGSDAVDAMIGSVNMVDEDYFNLFWNLNNFDMANQWL